MPLSGKSLEAPFDIFRLLQYGLENKPDDLALISTVARWTWKELDQASDNLAGNLLKLGLEPGDRIASLMPNRAHLLIHYLACFKAGLIIVPLNYRYTTPEVDYALGVSEASILLVHGERIAELADSQSVPRLPYGVISYESRGSVFTQFEEMIEPVAGNPALSVPDSTKPAVIFFTSGSTGRPKGVIHTVESLGWMLASCARAFELNPEDIILPGSSISHLGGFMFSFAALGMGARAVVARTYASEEVITLLREDRPTILCMLPTALLHVLRDGDITCEDFSSLRICRSGSDKVPAELEREFKLITGLDIDEGYGMTEVGLATLNPPSGIIKFGSVGCPNPGFEVSVRDEAGKELPNGQEGRLWMKTRSATVGYWNNPVATQELFQNGWLDSGDVMRIDEDGYLFFMGRKKQIIVHDGSNISPQEIEEILLEHPAVDNAGVIGVHDLVHGENVRAYVAIRKGSARPSAIELIQFSRERVGYKAPEEIEFLSDIPLNATGKVDRVRLKKMAEQCHRP